MARKVFKAGDVKLHVITTNNGVIIIKVVNKASNEIINENAFNGITPHLEKFVEPYLDEAGIDKLIEYLNNL